MNRWRLIWRDGSCCHKSGLCRESRLLSPTAEVSTGFDLVPREIEQEGCFFLLFVVFFASVFKPIWIIFNVPKRM